MDYKNLFHINQITKPLKNLYRQATENFRKILFLKARKRDSRNSTKGPQRYHFIEGVLYTLLAQKTAREPFEKFNVLQIGANDGYTVDPVFNFCGILEKNKVRLAAVEPLPEVFDLLIKTYANHSDFHPYNILIGSGNTQTIYKIKSKYWPQYRGIIGSGVSSMNYDHVLRKAQKQLPKSLTKNKNIENFIENQEIACISLTRLIKEWGHTPDFLQIDVEGYDDDVIYSLDMSQFKPKAIGFEVCLLSQDRKNRLFEYLSEHNYIIATASEDDACAILKN